MVGALINLVGHYFIGLPIGVSLMFPAKMGIVGKKGLWRTPRRPPPPPRPFWTRFCPAKMGGGGKEGVWGAPPPPPPPPGVL